MEAIRRMHPPYRLGPRLITASSLRTCSLSISRNRACIVPSSFRPLLPHNALSVRYAHSEPKLKADPITELGKTFGETQPRFPVRGDEIEVLSEPEQFYKALLGLIKRAKRRLVISSLYIGTEQDELLAAIRTALNTSPSLKVTFLLDHNRCTREPWPTKSTASILYPLVRDFPGRAEAWFYRSPKLSGVMEWLVPRRFDEGWGTWHAKIYGGDEEVIISGANLSKDYFSTRQDRYFYFRNSLHLTTYLSNLLRLYTGYSYLLTPTTFTAASASTSTLKSSSSSSSSPSSALTASASTEPQPYALYWPHTTVDPRDFHAHAFATLSAFQASWSRKTRDWEGKRVDADTSVWPVLQAGVLGIKEEERAMSAVWKAVDKFKEEGRALVDLTSGYFSLYDMYKKAVIESKADVRIIAAAPKSNGFFGSKGISGLIPEGYTLLERDFEREVSRRGRSWTVTPSQTDSSSSSLVTTTKSIPDEKSEKPTGTSGLTGSHLGSSPGTGHGVELTEWQRDGWTYHSKGLSS
ncbi:Phosphatidylglycerolphosphate synthase [Phaffia rhodozyma]|uniref:CDP-diacylglycerol--glycerol-3-phosphate 3-phosphatidyltransferase n=1 Tax=Phaffia rhodozyma TaxID=264483 RepID=A0A0F7SRG0_PHARH|nr:Phosphatidylglycerolphosphate synthase [Phaffia rhodozyma]